MADKKPSAPVEKKSGGKKFHPADLSVEQQEQVIEYYFGVHPQFMLIRNDEIRLDVWNLAHHGKHFEGFFPNQLRIGRTDEKGLKEQRGKLGY